jgi:outer membrane autotransporter protein
MGFYNNTVQRIAVLPSTIVPMQAGDAPGSFSQVAFGAEENLTTGFDSHSVDGAVEAGRRSRLWSLDVTPFGGVQFSHLHANEYADSPPSGTSLIGLNHLAHSTLSVPAVAGVQLGGGGELSGNLRLSLFTRLAWRHEFQTARTTENAFITAPDVSFVVHGAEPVQDALRANLDLRAVIFRRVSAYVNVQGDFSRAAKTDISRSFGFSLVW